MMYPSGESDRELLFAGVVIPVGEGRRQVHVERLRSEGLLDRELDVRDLDHAVEHRQLDRVDPSDRVIVDTVYDDRDPMLVQLSTGDILLSWFLLRCKKCW